MQTPGFPHLLTHILMIFPSTCNQTSLGPPVVPAAADSPPLLAKRVKMQACASIQTQTE